MVDIERGVTADGESLAAEHFCKRVTEAISSRELGGNVEEWRSLAAWARLSGKITGKEEDVIGRAIVNRAKKTGENYQQVIDTMLRKGAGIILPQNLF